MTNNVENNVEFIRDEKVATCSFSQGRFISRIKALAEKFPEDCQIVAENSDGSIVAHFPVKWLHISNRTRNISEDEKQILRERLVSVRENRN